MIGERSELLARLLRYHGLVRGMADSKARDALRGAIAGIERRLAELEDAEMPGAAQPPHRPHVSRAR